MPKTRVHVIVEGRVQGVWFRAATQDEARRLGICGWVRNLPDGNVEAVFEGEEERVNCMVRWCGQGPNGARVDDLSVDCEDHKGEFNGFSITF